MTATDRPSPPEPRGSSGDEDWEEIAARPEFQELRRRLRSFVFPMAAVFLAWYLLYVLMASYAPAFMATKLAGNINVGLVFGLLQFVSTFLITFLYVRFAGRRLDPLAADLRRDIEGGDIEGGDIEGGKSESGHGAARNPDGAQIEEDVK